MPTDGYQGQPDFHDIPLGRDEQAPPLPDDLEGFHVGNGPQRVHPQGFNQFDTEVCHPPDPVELVEPRGELYPNCHLAQKGIQTFSLWSDDPANFGTPSSWQSYRMIRSPKVEGNLATLWMIDLWAYERLRIVEPENGPVEPLRSSEILMTGGAAASQDAGLGSTRLKAKIGWWASSGGATRIADIGQGIRCALEASLVTVEILFPIPGNTTDVVNPNTSSPQLAPTGGIVLDTVIGASITNTTSTPGQQNMTNTFIVPIAAGQADVPVLVPPGSRSVSVYQTRDGSVLNPSWQLGRDAAAPIGSIGAIDLGSQRRAEKLDRPAASGMILSGPADGQSDRLATFVFNLEI